MKSIALLALAGLARLAHAGPVDKEPAVMAMKDELARSMSKLELPNALKPYFMSYEYWDQRTAHADASFGALSGSSEGHRRFIDIDIRVGSPAFDNSNLAQDFGSRASVTISIDDDYGSIRRDLWLATDGAYKGAIESLERKQAVAKAENKSADDIGSFSTEKPTQITDRTTTKPLDLRRMEALAKKLSAVFRTNPDVYRGVASVSARAGKRYFVSSEGGLSAQADASVTVWISCDTQATDGMKLHDELRFQARNLDELPPEAELVRQAEQLAKRLSTLRSAPIVDDYAGPVLFTGVAADQVLRALLAEQFSGTLAPKGDRPGMGSFGESELAGKVGQRILPAGVDVIDDPSLEKLGNQAVLGGYKFDEEGIAGTKVLVVENGVFRRFLMSRAPRKGFEHSTGHGRSTPLAPVRAHPSNLVLSAKTKVADGDMRKRAIKAAKAAGLSYVLVADHLATGIDRDDIDFSALANGGSPVPRPLGLERVYLDGRKEIVRGGSFAGVQLRSLKDLVAIGTTPVPYNYTASGLGARFDAMVPNPQGFTVSISSPSLLFHDIDVKKPVKAQRKPPVASRPALPTK
jgi:TldD protein